MAKQEQGIVLEDIGVGQGRRVLGFQKQELTSFHVSPQEVLGLIPSEALLAELIRRRELEPNGRKGHYHHIGRAVDDLRGQKRVLRIIEMAALDYALCVTGNITDAAKILGISRPTYYYKTRYRNDSQVIKAERPQTTMLGCGEDRCIAKKARGERQGDSAEGDGSKRS